MGSVKQVKIAVDSFGSFLGMEKGCIILRDKKGNTTKYPLFEAEIGEVILKSGNLVSTGVLSAPRVLANRRSDNYEKWIPYCYAEEPRG